MRSEISGRRSRVTPTLNLVFTRLHEFLVFWNVINRETAYRCTGFRRIVRNWVDFDLQWISSR